MATPTYRVATLQDVEQLADCATAAMMDDDLFGMLYPKRKEDPYHFRQRFRRRGRQRLVFQNFVTVVAEMPIVEDGVEKKMIVGFAQWEKFGKESAETRWNPIKACELKLIKLEDWIYSFFDKDTAIDMEAANNLGHDLEEIENTYWKKDGEDHNRWHLQLLGVHPIARRKGIGASLVKQGLWRARRDGCDVGLEASPMGLPLYKSLGFKVFAVYDMKTPKLDGTPSETPVLLWSNPDAVNREA